MTEEIERRRKLVAERATDIDRWARRESFPPQWGYRARLAAEMIPICSSVLDIGAGAMDLERVLPEGCSYQPCDLVRWDERTIVCDLNKGEFPRDLTPDVVTLLGVLEYVQDPLALMRKLRGLGCPVVCSYSITDRRPDVDRAAEGWINSFAFAQLETLMREAGFRLQCRQLIDPLQDLFKWIPTDATQRQLAAPKRVLVLSYYNAYNFGDRLGYHVINGLLPSDALVTHATVKPWSVPAEPFDLLILGTGHSLNATTIRRAELHQLVERIPHTIGIFGTAYRYTYRDPETAALIDRLLSNLTTWWARYEEDINAIGRGRPNVRHLGDILISAFPMASPSLDRTLAIPAGMQNVDAPLDRVIQQIQAYKYVSSARIHPLLCALTSAIAVKYQEQSERVELDEIEENSGKFRSQLIDIFGRTFEEDKFFGVDRSAVTRYKLKVEENMAALRTQIADLLS